MLLTVILSWHKTVNDSIVNSSRVIIYLTYYTTTIAAFINYNVKYYTLNIYYTIANAVYVILPKISSWWQKIY